MTKAFLFRLPMSDYVRYAAAAQRRRQSTASFIREACAVGARQIAGGEKAVAPVQNKPVLEPRLPARPVGRTAVTDASEQARRLAAAGGKCEADVAYGTHCKICGRVHR